MLRHREDVRPVRLPVPARDAGEPVGDVGDLDVERRGIEQIEPAAGQHALPRAWYRGSYQRVTVDLFRFYVIGSLSLSNDGGGGGVMCSCALLRRV